MFQARIVSPRGSLYFAAEATPYDLENLRTHIRELQTPRKKDVRLEFSCDQGGGGGMDQRVSLWLQRLAAEGVQVSLFPSEGPSGARTPQARR